MRVEYRTRLSGYDVVLTFTDTGGPQGAMVGTIAQISRGISPKPWVFKPAPEALRQCHGFGFDLEVIERNTLRAVKVELEARMFVALVGDRHYNPNSEVD